MSSHAWGAQVRQSWTGREQQLAQEDPLRM